MKNTNSRLQELYKGDMLSELPLSLSLLTLPPKHENDDKSTLRLTSCSFYRTPYYHCVPCQKRISRIISPTQE